MRWLVLVLSVPLLLHAGLALAQVSDAAPRLSQSDPLIEERVSLPVSFRAANGTIVQERLDTLIVRPSIQGRLPLAIITHGTHREVAPRATLDPSLYLPVARSFARRGWAAAIVIRHGFGKSSGQFGEGFGDCTKPNYVYAAYTGATDLLAAFTVLAQQPYVDPRQILGIGHSTGGLAWLAAASTQPQGLIGVINLAGGNGSLAADTNCSEQALIDAVGKFGQSSKVPTLWLYAENDHYFGPRLVRAMFDRYRAAGGQAQYEPLSAFGDDGHGLFADGSGGEKWLPAFDNFSRRMRWPSWEPRPTDLTALAGVHRDHFAQYLSAANEKAFALSDDGSWDWWVGPRDSLAIATREALDNCEQNGKRHCRLYAVNFSVTKPY